MALSLDEALGMSLVDETDESIHVDIDTRQVTIPESQQVFGVESDEDVEVKHIVIDGRYNDGTDLSTFTFRVNYQNANGDKGTYLATELKVNDSSIEFDWIIGRQVVAYKGTIAFIVCAYTIDSSSVIQNEWNSTLGKGTVLEGLEVSEFDFGDDIVRQLASILSDVNAAQASAKASADEAEKSKNIASTSAINAKASADKAESLVADMPDDYATALKDVSQLKKNKLDKPNNPVVGQFLRVKSISDTGEIVLETMAGGVGSGLPNGGTVGQVLAKKSDVDGDAEWADMESEEVTADNITQALGYTPRKAWYVNVTLGDPITADKTAAEIWKAYQDGYSVFAMVALDGVYPFALPLVLPMDAEAFGFATIGQMSEDSTPMTVCLACNTYGWRFFTCKIAPSNAIPTALKNPNALTVKIGSTTVTYDGSSAETVEIADGTEVSY